MKCTPSQIAALARIVADWDRANAANIARWGVGLTGEISVATGVGGACVAREARTLHALHAASLIKLTAQINTSDRLRRGHFGRWITGTERVTYVTFTASPTAAGRALIKASV